jgi:hypothetical protein
MTLIGSSATSTSISPTLEPTQNIPKRKNGRCLGSDAGMRASAA